MYIDTHCHLDDKMIASISDEISECRRYGITKVINMGCNTQSSKCGKDLSKKYDEVYFGVGVHPSDIDDLFGNEDLLISLSSDEKCVAVGEIGLDYHYTDSDKEKQISGFISQLELAYNLKLPVSVHSRDATFDMMKILKENKRLLDYGGVMHCFSGSVETAKELLNLGFYLGFGGTSTFKNAKTVLKVIGFCPLDFMLTETDSPYLAPEPLRGSVNGPKNIPIILNNLARIKGVENEILADKIMNNAKTLFTKLR